ncbi:MAG: YceI family protein [Porticoccaceae bacterium]|nr:YceI family protein [Porticoccaceae bacterium]
MKKYLFCFLSLWVSLGAQADWQLKGDDSSVNFISIKKSAIAEVHLFKQLSGSINNNGEVKVSIDLASVDTNIAIRNERMKSLLFDVNKFATANILAKVDSGKLKAMKKGGFYQDDVDIVLSLHGIEKKITTLINVVKLADGSIRVSSVHPVIITAQDFGLSEGVEALRVVANLSVISTAVPVTFNMVFAETD